MCFRLEDLSAFVASKARFDDLFFDLCELRRSRGGRRGRSVGRWTVFFVRMEGIFLILVLSISLFNN